MHELPITQSILEIALRHAEEAKAQKILSLNLKIGQFSSVVDDSVQFYWDIISKDTIAEGAKMNFHRIPAEMLCLDCNQGYKPTEDDLGCPVCGGLHVEIITGKEFLLDSIDIE